MTEQTPFDATADRPQQRWDPAPPSTAIGLGVLLAASGLWMTTDGGPLPLGWILFALGQALLLMGTVAKGVAWGLEIHRSEGG